VSESAVSAKPLLLMVWRETGAVRNARPSRGQAASTRRRTQWRKRREASAALVLAFFCKLWILLGIAVD
jgi:energy-coupling factor transporter transmembrane protein EcfT